MANTFYLRSRLDRSRFKVVRKPWKGRHNTASLLCRLPNPTDSDNRRQAAPLFSGFSAPGSEIVQPEPPVGLKTFGYTHQLNINEQRLNPFTAATALIKRV